MPFIDIARGDWLLRPDPDDVGLSQQWWGEPWRDAVEHRMPCAWQSTLGDEAPSVVWYRRERCPCPHDNDGTGAASRFWLEFDAVATDCRVWVNGHEVGCHVGDFAPIRFEITEFIDGDHFDLTVRVDRIAPVKPDPDHWLQGGHITKGFHDVLSLAHGGVWSCVFSGRTGPVAITPDGVSIKADPATGLVEILVETDGDAAVECWLTGCGDDGPSASGPANEPLTLKVDDPKCWSPDEPTLYSLGIEVTIDGVVSDFANPTIAFRSVEITDEHILLNGQPIFLSGVLDWGHEPAHGAPAPTPDEVRERFQRLRDMGFNCVCLCMYYPPRWFYQIADETGMLLWQEHPIWQSDMSDEHLPEYQRLCTAFMRRDRQHPSVIIVSATCEHPKLNPAFASWWWDEARRTLPDKLLQVQTASFAWADLDRTDLYDEHTYEDAPRWTTYLKDLQDELARQKRPLPFVMGESVLYTSWPDTRAIRSRIGDERPWWLPKGLDACAEFEDAMRATHGDALFDRFMKQGDRFHLRGRAFQMERFREHANHAGLVQNHLRDVPACRCGFIDDLDQWRFGPAQTRPFLAPAILTLRTPGHCCAAQAGEVLEASIGVSNASPRTIDAALHLNIAHDAYLSCDAGAVAHTPIRIPIPDADAPQRVTIAASLDGAEPNQWDLWALPTPTRSAEVHRLESPPIDPESVRLDVERGYSKGFGLPAPSAPFTPPNAATAWPDAKSLTDDARTIVTHRLTNDLVARLEAGASVVMLCSNAPGGVGSVAEWHFGAIPLVVEVGPLVEGDSDWIIDCLLVDLIATWCRAIPSESLGVADQLQPVIRQVFTHDQDRPVMLDLLACAHVGDGLLVLSSLDHNNLAGRWLMSRVLSWLAGAPASTGRLDPAIVRSWAI